jgi:sulfatase modifying factor 1
MAGMRWRGALFVFSLNWSLTRTSPIHSVAPHHPQGAFPLGNTAADGHQWAAPVDSFPAQNAFGLHHMSGNVWEWTASPWCPNVDPISGATIDLEDFSPPPPGGELLKRRPPAECSHLAIDPRARERLVADPGLVDFVKKGGSFMCHRRHCFRYRCAARDQNGANTGAHNLGARCVYDRRPEWAAAAATSQTQ